LTQVDLEIDNGSMIPYYENMEYDGIGNILGYSANREVPRHYSFSYDDARFPILPTDIEVTGSQPVRETFTYDHGGSRIQRELDADNNPATANEISYFIPFGTENLAELDGRGRVRRAYSFAGGERTGYKAAGRTVLYLKDHLGSSKMTLGLYASTLQEGLLQRAGDADPYGVTWRESYAATAESEPHQYTGQEREAALDLYTYGARFYDPELGRFLAVDPAREFANPYSYVGNNPVSRLDPTGNDFEVYIDDKAKTVRINVPIKVFGLGANEKTVERMSAAIEKTWGSKEWVVKSGYTVTVTANIELDQSLLQVFDPAKGPKSLDGREKMNYVFIDLPVDPDIRDSVEFGFFMRLGANVLDLYSSDRIQDDTPTYTYDDPFAHEVGHFMFLKDRYNQNDSGLSGHKGWENNIMNDSYVGVVESKNIEILFSGIVRERTPALVGPWSVYTPQSTHLWIARGRMFWGLFRHFD
jgi:RHS repeat-associated protein